MASTRPLVGIDIGGTGIKAAIVTPLGKVLGRARRDTLPEEGVERVLSRIEEAVVEACWKSGVDRSKLRAVGVGAPGAVDRSRGVVLSAVNLGWKDLRLADLLKKQLGLMVTIENDVDAAIWGEKLVGAGKGETEQLGVWVGTGIGGGLVLNNKLYTGRHNTAGEVGRGVVLPWAPPGQGSVEQVCSRTGMVETLTRLLRSGRSSSIAPGGKFDPEQIDNRALAKGLKSGDPLVVEVVEHAAMVLGTSIGGIITLLSLGRVVLGGGVTDALGRQWLEAVRRAAR
ncbi:MAG: ROK family protein, partial [Pyrinomonadaceae bacterium]|nr:ROK family protein [Phycisphaerales bacterium]